MDFIWKKLADFPQHQNGMMHSFFSFFSLGRCIPVVRGDGVYQYGVDFCVDKLSDNGWVHVFPEGKVTANAVRIKWGVARMVSCIISSNLHWRRWKLPYSTQYKKFH